MKISKIVIFFVVFWYQSVFTKYLKASTRSHLALLENTMYYWVLGCIFLLPQQFF